MDKISIIILAAGKGSRMNLSLPKVLTKLGNVSLIQNLLTTIAGIKYPHHISVVVGFRGEEVINALSNLEDCNFIWQLDQLGTGHAVQQCKNSLQGKFKEHLILYGDVPFISAETINKIIELHHQKKSILTMATLKINDFMGSNQAYWHFGRIIRNKQGQIFKIVEFKDADEEEKKITEINPAIYCVNDQWLWQNLAKLNNTNNNQREYYLTDLVNLAHQQGLEINSLVVENKLELMGVNTPQDLEIANQIYRNKN